MVRAARSAVGEDLEALLCILQLGDQVLHLCKRARYLHLSILATGVLRGRGAAEHAMLRGDTDPDALSACKRGGEGGWAPLS